MLLPDTPLPIPARQLNSPGTPPNTVVDTVWWRLVDHSVLEGAVAVIVFIGMARSSEIVVFGELVA